MNFNAEMRKLRGTYRFASIACVIFTVGLFYYTFFVPSGNNNRVVVEQLKQGGLKHDYAIRDKKPLILFYTLLFRETPTFGECSLPCDFSTNVSDYPRADAVVFHATDYVPRQAPRKRAHPDQKWVLYTMETMYSLQRINGLSAFQPDWIMDYMTNAHIRAPYGGYFVDPETSKGKRFQPIANFTIEQVLKDKQFRGAIAFISNCRSQKRLQAIKALSKHIRVDLGGKCAFDANKNDLCPRSSDCTPLINWYYFYLAFENSDCMDYATEKFVDRLNQPVVPIVMKREVYRNIFPPEAFIAVDDFKTPKEMAAYLDHLTRHPKDYYKMFEWRKHWTRAPWNGPGYEMGLCGLCKKLLESGKEPTQPVRDVQKWLQQQAPCYEDELPQPWKDTAR